MDVLARVYALQLQCGTISWTQLEERVLAPFDSLSNFWLYCSSLTQRHLAVFMAAYVVQAAPSVLPSGPKNGAVWLLKMWFRSLIDYGRKATLGFMTHVLARQCHETHDLFAGCVPEHTKVTEHILADVDGVYRGGLVRHVLWAMSGSVVWSTHILECVEGLHEVHHQS